ncbi:MAG: alpha/beta hydrolase, partial [Alphaproteobacteria bacterium]|nr:alpha/beta hydrolase [Alphaproteobacteria bacterium]
SSGLYAQEMAERGFVTLAFDPSFTGESGGDVRNVASPDINTDDFSAAVDSLSTLPQVDENKIGIIGICGFGGFGLNAAAQDTRIKATVTSTMYDMTRVSSKGYNDSMTAADLYKLRVSLNNQRTADAKNGSFAPAAGLPDKLTGKEPQFVKDYFDYYKTPRGFHKRSINSNGHWNTTSALSLITQPILAYSGTIKSAVLMLHGEKAHSRYFSEDAFKKLKGKNKELYIIPGANHVDLYDRKDIIPFDKMEKFFKKNLK